MNRYIAPPSDWDCGILLSRIPKDGEPLYESFELPLDGSIDHWGVNYTAAGPISADAVVSLTGNRILVRIVLKAEFFLPCSRCLCETPLAINGDMRYLFTLRFDKDEPEGSGYPVEEDGDVDVIPLDLFQSELDLKSYVWEVLLLNLPERVLCSDDCKGLCPVCGHNRNETECGCKEEDVDPRFAVLRDFKAD